nr:MAG TPA: hypothetical protein [Caudoviricetes sp.]DAR76839.1 MAG TPA: hypothetical protein [Caudoviricetes sp.]
MKFISKNFIVITHFLKNMIFLVILLFQTN